MGAAAGHRAKDKGQRHLITQRLQSVAQHIGQPGGFAHQRLQLGKDRVITVRLELHLVAHPLTEQQTHVAQRVQLFFQRTGCGLRLACQFAQMQLLIRLHQQQRQHLAPVLVGKKQLRKRGFCFQNKNNRFLIENVLRIKKHWFRALSY